MCPSGNGQCCADDEGGVYCILCNMHLSGIPILNSGKPMEKEKRSYTGSFEGCTGFCDTYNSSLCAGVAYGDWNCLAYDTITGTFPNEEGGFVGLRQS